MNESMLVSWARFCCNSTTFDKAVQGKTPTLDYLGSTFRILFQTEADEHGVRHFDQDVVDAVHMHTLRATLCHVVQNAMLLQSAVQATIPICRCKV